jgi:aspartate racemase
MKSIGLIGGMSWESSLEYYRILNQIAKARLGGYHSAKCILYSVDFAEIETWQSQGKWQEAASALTEAGQNLERAGADIIVLCTNTMHKVAGEIQSGITIPFLHIADATAQKVRDAGFTRVGLLGTKFTMEEDFYKSRLIQGYGLEVIIPEARDRAIVHRVIFDELVVGIIKSESKKQYLEIIESLVMAGAECIILGCTEIGSLVRAEDCRVPLFDTTQIHAEAAFDWALKE